MRKSRRTMAGIAAVAGLVLSPLSAAAQTTQVDDRRGDSPSEAVDLTHLKVRHGRHRITVKATMPQLEAGRLSGLELLIRPQGKRKVYSATVLRDRQGQVVDRRLGWRPLNDPIEPPLLPCSGIRSSIDGDVARLSVPKRCLTKAPQDRAIKAKVRTVDGTHDLVGPYYDDQTPMSDLVPPGPAGAGGAEGEVRADGGLLVRQLPTMFSARQGHLRDGTVVPIDCRVTGSVVRRDDDEDGQLSNLWYRLPGGGREFVSALYVRSIGGRVPYCGDGRTYRGRATTKLLVPREAPTTRANSHGGLFRGATVRINCKLHAKPVRGNDLWYNLPQGLWVSARYVDNVGSVPALCVG